MSNKRISSVIALGICMLMLAGCNPASTAPQTPTQEATETPATEETATEEAKDSAGGYKTDIFEITVPDDLCSISKMPSASVVVPTVVSAHQTFAPTSGSPLSSYTMPCK